MHGLMHARDDPCAHLPDFLRLSRYMVGLRSWHLWSRMLRRNFMMPALVRPHQHALHRLQSRSRALLRHQQPARDKAHTCHTGGVHAHMAAQQRRLRCYNASALRIRSLHCHMAPAHKSRRSECAGCEWRAFSGESDTGACVVSGQDVPDELDRSKVNTITAAECTNRNQQPTDCAEAVSAWLIETGCNADCVLEQIQASKACSQDLTPGQCKERRAPSCAQFSGASTLMPALAQGMALAAIAAWTVFA